MLAPVTEAEFGEEPSLRAQPRRRRALAGVRRGAGGAHRAATGYRDAGALVVAADRDDAEELRRLHEFQQSLGLDVRSGWRRGAAAGSSRGLSPRIAGGDPRAARRARSTRALYARAQLAAAGGELALGVEVERIEHATVG